MIAVRLAETDADLEGWTEVQNEVEPDQPSTLDELLVVLRRQPETRLWLADLAGETVGCCVVTLSSVPGRAFVLPRVVPRARRRGAGSALLAAAREYGAALGCAQARTRVDGADAESLDFAARRGFAEVDREVELVRTLRADEEPAQAPDGIELAAPPTADPEALRALVAAGVADMPVVGGLSSELVDELLDELARALHVVVATDAGTPVGVAGLLPYGARDGALEHAFTTVLPTHRRRGVALALKQACVEWAARCGYREIVTWTQAGNAGMQAVNDRAGFALGTQSITLEAPLERRPAAPAQPMLATSRSTV